MKLFRSIFSGLPIMAGVIIILLSSGEIIGGYQTKGWQLTNGIVIDGVEKKSLFSFSRVAMHSYDLFVYKYEVNGYEYTGSKIGFGTNSVNKEYEIGNQVDVYFDSNKPENAVILVGVNKGSLLSVIVGVFLILIGVTLWKRITL